MPHIDAQVASEIAEKTGWTPPIIYDFATDSHRLATQEDLDRLMGVQQAYSRLAALLQRELADTKAEFQARNEARRNG